MIPQFNGQEIVGLAFAKDASRPVIGTRMAIWIPAERGWKPELRGRVRQLMRLNDGRVLAIVGGRGELANGKPMVSADGVNWAPYETANNAQSRLPRLENPEVPIQQLARELHSGAFFIGKGPGEIFWSITFGLILGLLAITGLWMWIKSERQKAGRHQHGKSVHE
ncbi:MAG: PepSY domain-containing protein [Xanthomonadales bacterium]|jgi:hypothetical protein|nr:PepSY domain-containing protein [Xanthomonadales bacterium]